MTGLTLKTSATSTLKITEPKMRAITGIPSIGETLTYVNREERTELRVTVVFWCEQFTLVETLPPIRKLDGTGIFLKAYPGMLYE